MENESNIKSYDYAIAHNETKDFLLGKGKYLHPDYEWADTHKPSDTFWYIQDYGKRKGYSILLKQLESDINTVLHENITPFDLLVIKTYIWIYARMFYEEKKDLLKWDISNTTKTLFKQQLDKFVALYGINGGSFKRDADNNEFNVDQLLKSVQLLQKRFGINLME